MLNFVRTREAVRMRSMQSVRSVPPTLQSIVSLTRIWPMLSHGTSRSSNGRTWVRPGATGPTSSAMRRRSRHRCRTARGPAAAHRCGRHASGLFGDQIGAAPAAPPGAAGNRLELVQLERQRRLLLRSGARRRKSARRRRTAAQRSHGEILPIRIKAGVIRRWSGSAELGDGPLHELRPFRRPVSTICWLGRGCGPPR